MATLARQESKRDKVYTRISRDLWAIIRKEAFDRRTSISGVLDEIVREALLAKQSAKRSA